MTRSLAMWSTAVTLLSWLPGVAAAAVGARSLAPVMALEANAGAPPPIACCDGPPSAAALNPMAVRRLAGVTLATADLQASTKWWSDKMGFAAGKRFQQKFGTTQRMELFGGWLL